MDCSLPGSSFHGIFQARTLEWLPFPSPGDLPDPGIEPRSSALQVDSLPAEDTREANFLQVKSLNFYTVIEYESFKGIMDSKVPYIQYIFTVRVA